MIIIPIQVRIKTLYQLISVNPVTGKETVLTNKFGNTILTSGRNELANRDWFVSCHVGTNNTPPDAAQGGLFGFVAASSVVQETVTGVEATYGWKRKRIRFGVGEAAANLNEIAIAWSNTDGDCVTRALTEDINGQQNTITPLPDEYLDAVIEVQYHWPQVDATGTVVLNSVTYNYTIRPSQVNVISAWASTIGDKIESYAISVSDWAFYDGDIAAANAPPNGVKYDSDNANDYTNAYSSASYQIIFGMIGGANAWNATTGNLARTLVFKTTAGWWQCQLDSQAVPGQGAPKTTSETMKMEFILGWDEAP